MKIGKVPETVLKRAVFNQIQTKRPEVILGAGVGEDCAAIELQEDEVFILSTDPITGTTQEIGTLAIHITMNDLASAGAEPVGVMLTILLPEGTEEQSLRELMKQLSEGCSQIGVQIIGGHTEVTKAVNQPLISVTGVGKVQKGKMVTTSGARPGQDLVVTKWIGIEGTSILAKEREQDLLTRLPQHLIDTAKDFDQLLSVVPEGRIAASFGVSAMHDVTEGGIFGALWEVASASHAGLEADLKKIPVKQETIEICECLGISPYELISSGSMLIAADDGNGLVRELDKAGIQAAVVGKITSSNDRVIYNGEEKRFLEPPKTDQLYDGLTAGISK